MSERLSTWIRIGGRVKRSRLKPLLKAICDAGVRTDWGDAWFEPKAADELLEAKQESHLYLCDDEARYGEFPEIEKVCRRLKLSYRRQCDGGCVYDPELVDWRPGMKDPVAQRASTEHEGEALILASAVKEALALLEADKVRPAINKLKKLCMVVADLPPFEIV